MIKAHPRGLNRVLILKMGLFTFGPVLLKVGQGWASGVQFSMLGRRLLSAGGRSCVRGAPLPLRVLIVVI